MLSKQQHADSVDEEGGPVDDEWDGEDDVLYERDCPGDKHKRHMHRDDSPGLTPSEIELENLGYQDSDDDLGAVAEDLREVPNDYDDEAVNRKHDRFMKKDASSRLQALRGNQELCDALIVGFNGRTFAVHLAILAGTSSVLKKALCGDVKDGKQKSIDLKNPSDVVVNFILDYAYGISNSVRLSDFDLCIDVWKDSFEYRIDGLHRAVFAFAMEKFWPQRIVDMVQYVELYSSEE